MDNMNVAGLDKGWTELDLDESEATYELWFTDNSYNSFVLAGDGEIYVGESTWDPKFAKDQYPNLKAHENKTYEGWELKYSSKEDMFRKNIMQLIQGISDVFGLFAISTLTAW